MTVSYPKTALAKLAFAAHYQSRDRAKNQADQASVGPRIPAALLTGLAGFAAGRRTTATITPAPAPRRQLTRYLAPHSWLWRRTASSRSEATQQSWADVCPSTQLYVTFPALHEHKVLVNMDHGITHSSHCKIYLRLAGWLRARAERIGERAFAAPDAAARQHDWQIISAHAGLGRQYRDPRFDNLATDPSRRRPA
jgi:hypothetical protein